MKLGLLILNWKEIIMCGKTVCLLSFVFIVLISCGESEVTKDKIRTIETYDEGIEIADISINEDGSGYTVQLNIAGEIYNYHYETVGKQ